MSQFYEIDSTRHTLREYWWGNRSPIVLIAWLLKPLPVRTPPPSDDPNTDSTVPFVTESLPPEIESKFQPLRVELETLGFSTPIYHVIYDPGSRTKIYWASFLHPSGKYFARIHHRIWHQAQKSERGLFPIFFTAFADGTFLVSSAGKPDMEAPASIQMQRLRGASTRKVFEAHERALAAIDRKNIAPVLTRDDLLNITERYHGLVRDFHLQRGAFRERTAVEQKNVETFTQRVAEAQTSGHKYPEVIAEIDRLQDKKPSWSNAIWVLLLSFIAFVAIGAANWDWKFTLWIIPILLIHEGGHWVAMRLFNYRNVRMFFLPFFGAAVTGQNWNVAGWKKAFVSLAGPLPGIAIGVVLAIAALILQKQWLNYVAVLMLFVNGFNLLPVLPLDGGRVLQDTLFCRNRWLDGAFRIVAVLGLLALSHFLGGKAMLFLAIAMAVALPVAFKLGKVADQMRSVASP